MWVKSKLKKVSPNGDWGITESGHFVHISRFSFWAKTGFLKLVAEYDYEITGAVGGDNTLGFCTIERIVQSVQYTNTGHIFIPFDQLGQYIAPIGKVENGLRSGRSPVFLVPPGGGKIYIKKEKGIFKYPEVLLCDRDTIMDLFLKWINPKIIDYAGKESKRGDFSIFNTLIPGEVIVKIIKK